MNNPGRRISSNQGLVILLVPYLFFVIVGSRAGHRTTDAKPRLYESAEIVQVMTSPDRKYVAMLDREGSVTISAMNSNGILRHLYTYPSDNARGTSRLNESRTDLGKIHLVALNGPSSESYDLALTVTDINGHPYTVYLTETRVGVEARMR